MKIVIDAFGGDKAPEEIVEGAVLAVKKNKEVSIILCGDEEKIKNILNGRTERIEICHAPDVISNNDVPTDAIRHKKDSSLVKAFDVLNQDEDAIALISAGSTGAILTGAVLKTGRIKGIQRPALAPVCPTIQDKDALIVDSGANIDCKAINLYQFAIMGSAYYTALYGVEKPKVGLLNVGVEEHKGTELIREAYEMLKTAPVNFIGNIEARDFLSGDVDVLVSEGFAGNVLLKGSEGAITATIKILKNSIKSRFWSKIGALFMKKSFKDLKNKIDVQTSHGGATFLGCKKLVIKNHGTSTRENVVASVEQAVNLHKNQLINKIEELLKEGEVE